MRRITLRPLRVSWSWSTGVPGRAWSGWPGAIPRKVGTPRRGGGSVACHYRAVGGRGLGISPKAACGILVARAGMTVEGVVKLGESAARLWRSAAKIGWDW